MLWIIFALGAALSWGLYGPALHRGQVALGSPMRALLCVGIAYFLIGVLVPVTTLSYQGELHGFTMKNISFMAWISCAIILFCVAEGTAQVGGDWPQWRGRNRDGKSKETGLLKQGPTDGPPLAWKTKGAGRGYSSLAVANGRLFTMRLRGDSEFVMAFV